MKVYVKVFLLALAAALTACVSVQKFEDAVGRDWSLVEVRTGQQNITIDRNKSTNDGFGDIFTLHFDEGRISGVGAPNRYFAPYTLTDKQGMTIGIIAGTLMAALFEPENLKEHEFFAYLQNVERWNIVKGNLELYSKREDGSQTVLIFSPAE